MHELKLNFNYAMKKIHYTNSPGNPFLHSSLQECQTRTCFSDVAVSKKKKEKETKP